MTIRAILPAKGRDLRLDLFRGLANWAIFLDHVPNNAVAWLTTRNYGFSDAADIFVFISGYTAAFVYAKSMLVQGFVAGTARLLKRVWQLYIAHVLLFVFYVAAIGWVAEAYNHSHLVDEFNVAGLIDRPMLTLKQGLLLKFKPLNLDVLPLYIVLMAAFPLILWLMLWRPDLAFASSLALYFAARQFGWNLPAYPSGVWYFNPFTWQLLFVLGAWSSLGGAARLHRFIRSPAIVSICFVYLGFALFMTVAGYVAALGKLIPEGLFGAFNPNDKTNLAPYRVLHFIALAVLVVRFLPLGWAGLESRWFRPLIVCGQRSLEVFCVGVFLSFVGHFLLELVSDSLFAQIIVSVSGIALMTAVAYYRSWSKDLDKQPAVSKSSAEPGSTSVTQNFVRRKRCLEQSRSSTEYGPRDMDNSGKYPTVFNRRGVLRLTAALLAFPNGTTSAAESVVLVHKDPNCGCCSGWVRHLQAAGFAVTIEETADLHTVRKRLRVPADLAACHTAEADGYVIEGHVPAAAVRRLLKERPNAVGLAVPGMPSGSPGMEGRRVDSYDVVLFDASSRRTYMRFIGGDIAG